MKRPLRKTALASILFAGAMLAVAVTAEAQQPTKIPRIGYLVASSVAGSASRLTALRQGLRDLGYVEGKNVILEIRSADGTENAALPSPRSLCVCK